MRLIRFRTGRLSMCRITEVRSIIAILANPGQPYQNIHKNNSLAICSRLKRILTFSKAPKGGELGNLKPPVSAWTTSSLSWRR